jgi:2-oxoglutarate ferredoxin oxidoreductase subunit alpha
MRIRAFPFPAEVEAFLQAHEINIVIEQNRDAQLKTLLTIETGIEKAKLGSLLVYGGYPLSCHHVVDGVRAQLGKAPAKGGN